MIVREYINQDEGFVILVIYVIVQRVKYFWGYQFFVLRCVLFVGMFFLVGVGVYWIVLYDMIIYQGLL